MHRVAHRAASRIQLNRLATKTDSAESVGYCFDSGFGLSSFSRGLTDFSSLAGLIGQSLESVRAVFKYSSIFATISGCLSAMFSFSPGSVLRWYTSIGVLVPRF